MNVLGVAGLGTRDAACALLSDGRLVAAVEQKKLSGQSAIRECLRIAGAAPGVLAVARPVSEFTLQELRRRFPGTQITLVDHHLAHAASALHASPFGSGVVLTLDSGHDLVSAQLWSPQLTSMRQMLFPDSVGELYSRVTELLGLDRRADEHKVQWMSAEGDNRFVGLFESILGEPWIAMDRSFHRDDHAARGRFGEKFYAALGLKEGPEIPDNLRCHIAAGVQRAVEKYVLRLAPIGGNIHLAGGVFFNALLVRAFETSSCWENVFVQPAAGNTGNAIGAAYAASTDEPKPMQTLALGPEYSAEEVKQVLENCKLRFRYLLTNDEIVSSAIRLLNDQKIVAWMQGRMEFGPRALGNRSILASPLDAYASENLNVYIKHREGFRKFAAAVPSERCAEYFEAGSNARFLATVGTVRPEHRETFQTALMGEGLIRVHAVDKAENPLFHRLLTEFGAATGIPVLYNTSFNLFGDPLVCTPRDAVRSFYSSGIDAMIAGNFLLEK